MIGRRGEGEEVDIRLEGVDDGLVGVRDGGDGLGGDDGDGEVVVVSEVLGELEDGDEVADAGAAEHDDVSAFEIRHR